NLLGLLARTAITKLCLVHGDVSPKNILVGPRGPVFLDAECAWYGDPAFDLAFCLNHLLLKCLWVPQAKSAFLNCLAALRGGYLERMSYEDPKSLEARTAALLPALLLARVDGKSPVEYLTDGKDLVRRVARALLAQPPATLGEIQKAWQEPSRVEAEVIVGRGTTPLASGRAIAPAGASTGSGEAKSVDVPRAVQNINTRIRDALRALSVSDQAALDRRLIELDGTADKSRLGANA